MLEPIDQRPSSSDTTAADVSSHDVSIPRINIQKKVSGPFIDQVAQRLGIRGGGDAALGNDGRHVLVRCDVKGRIANVSGLRRQSRGPEVGDLAGVALLDGNV